MSTKDFVGLDFETYSAVSLPDHGLDRYSSDCTFRPLIGASYGKHSDPSVRLTGRFDFVQDYYSSARSGLIEAIEDRYIVAHNAGFERRVLETMGYPLPASRFIDSAVVARAAGAAGKLEAAAPQLLSSDKMPEGWDLIKLFSIPSAEREGMPFDPAIILGNEDKWTTFMDYCVLDAQLSFGLMSRHGFILDDHELANQAITMEMNSRGWPVDVDSVREMYRRYLENVEATVSQFRMENDAAELNLNSLKQLKEWCSERGIKATSFDEKAVAKMHARISKRLDAADRGVRPLEHDKYVDYCAVLSMLECKKALGGSSLKKLKVILDTVGEDGRLRDQYLHIGAGQTWRTTGRSVQMQNLKRLAEPSDMDSLMDDATEWNNEELAANIRQVFTSSDPNGALIVGDFASVESRGLAWLANEGWKLEAYRNGEDIYKRLAADIYGTTYENVIKSQRQTGKVGELSCGYGAGGAAVQAFAQNMGVEMTEAEAAKLVSDWRAADPRIVAFWAKLDELLDAVLRLPVNHYVNTPVGDGCTITLFKRQAPLSLVNQDHRAQTIEVVMYDDNERVVLRRIFHGCYRNGRNICYFKPSERKTGSLWTDTFVDPKTGLTRHNTIYGGKLAGILTQSFCRELFFRALRKVEEWAAPNPGLTLIGQFHDEIVLDWTPASDLGLEECKAQLEQLMSVAYGFRGFPMAAEVKHDYRYTK